MSSDTKRQIILASASPRRREILKAAGYEFEIRPTDSDEGNVTGSPEEVVMELAYIKAKACADNICLNKKAESADSESAKRGLEKSEDECTADVQNTLNLKDADGSKMQDLYGKLIIGADTLVFLEDAQLGKPADKENWRTTIKSLSGKTHRVLTGVCLLWDDKVCKFYSSTEVQVAQMTDEEIDDFIARDEDMDKAGGYAIQGAFAKYIPSIRGEYNNVVGFPIAKFREEIVKNGIEL